MNLEELQRYFAAAATSGTGPIAGLDAVFVSRGSLSASERLAIYNRGYFYRLLDALGSVFVETKATLGEAEFERIGLSYLAAHPSEQPAVERLGRLFASSLRELFPPPNPLPDRAALEWARLCALVAPDPRAIAQASELVPADFPDSCLRFVPALHCSGSTAVWRSALRVTEAPLEVLEFQALEAAMGGASMSQVCALFDTGASAEDTQRAFRVIAGWFANEWVESVELPRP